jgi:hypothetical protein
MARIETWFDQDLKNPVPVRVLTGSAFSLDNLGNLIGVRVTDGGEIITLDGNVNGYCMLADGQTIPVNGSRSGNMASIVLPQTAYTVPGPIRISIKLTEGSAITTLLACVGTVVRTQTGNIVNPGSVVQDWSTQISAQLQACQDAADNMGAMVAVAFDPSSRYVVGTYVIKAGSLYRLTADHEAGTTWENTSKTQVPGGVMGEVSNLNRALDNSKTIFNIPDSITVPFSSVSAAVDPDTGANGTVGARSGYISFDKPICIDYAESEFTYCVWVYTNNSTSSASYSPSGKKYVSGKTIINPVEGSNPCFRVGLHRVNGGTIATDIATAEFGKFSVYALTDSSLTKSGVAADAETVGNIVFQLNGSAWAGKKWYCYGTSMSDTEISKTGKWPQVFEQLSGMEHHNYGIGSGGICPSLSHHGNIKDAIMECPWDVDLVTLEVGLNDFGSIDLGEIGDESNDTYAGNYTQCLKKLTLGTRAKVVAILLPQRTFTSTEQTVRQNPHRLFQGDAISKPYSFRDALDLEIELCRLYGVEVIDVSASLPLGWRNKVTIKDHLHNTDAGGLLYGTYIWNQVRNMMPCNVSFTQEDIGEVW